MDLLQNMISKKQIQELKKIEIEFYIQIKNLFYNILVESHKIYCVCAIIHIKNRSPEVISGADFDILCKNIRSTFASRKRRIERKAP